MKSRYLRFVFFLLFIVCADSLFAQTDGHHIGERDSKHKKGRQQKRNKTIQTPEKREELFQRTLKEKNFHLPDTSKHK